MPRKESEAVPEGNGPTPQDAGKMVTWEELRQAMSKMWGEVLREYIQVLVCFSLCFGVPFFFFFFFKSHLWPMDLIVTILPVVTTDLPISLRFTPYIFLSRCKFITLTTRQPMVEFYLSRSHAFRYERKNTNPTLV